jgi:hypothetical protein
MGRQVVPADINLLATRPFLLRLFYRRGVSHDVIIFPAARFGLWLLACFFGKGISRSPLRGRRVEGDSRIEKPQTRV